MLDTLNQEYVRTARAKGLKEQVVINTHALRNALIPIATLGGLVAIAAAVAFAVVASLGGARDAGTALLSVLRAEAAKIALIVVLLWLVLTNYKDVAIVWFIGSFLASALILSFAPALRDI
jgi:ATP synthase protein I